MSVVHFLAQSALGCLLGIIAKSIAFRSDQNSWIIFALLGTAGAAFGSKTARQIFGVNNIYAGWGLAVSGSVLILIAYRFIAT
jgi:uncharacterized membrane protein YeaQ/YmgE (transglycosylase-associated protein family)